jgi:ATP-dependent exoDNAse (exonuclease V) alpha subunit
MAIYFLNMRSFSRSNGSSAVSLAAYRAGERIKDEQTGKTYDHSGRQGVLYKEIMLPNQFSADQMSWAKDRTNLWNKAERAEKRINSRVAREFLIALPAELSPQGRMNLVAVFSRELVERYRFALDIAIHAPRDFPGSDPRNFHAHLLATTREATRAGLGEKTWVEWNDATRRERGLGSSVGELLHVRERWAMAANAALQLEHIDARVDHRTLRAQGIEREPKHVSRAAFEMSRPGYVQRPSQRQQVAAPKDLNDIAKEAAMRWLRYRQAQREAEPKSPDDVRQESAMKWLQYRQAQKEAEAQGKVKGKEQAKEARQISPSAASVKRGLDYDHSL